MGDRAQLNDSPAPLPAADPEAPSENRDVDATLSGLDLQAFADSLPNMAWVAAADGSVRWFNRRFYEYTGMQPRAALGWGWAPVYHPDDRERIRAAWEAAVAQGRPFSDEARMRAADGSYRWFVVCSLPMVDEHGRVRAWSGSGTDIEARKQVETALEDSEARFRGLADNMFQLAWIATGEGDIFWYNRRWYEYTGTTLEQVRGSGWRCVHHPDHLARVEARARCSLETGVAWEDTFPIRAADGSYRWFLSRAEPMRDAKGRLSRWFGTNTDITEQRETLQKLSDSEERLATAMAQARMGTYEIDLRSGGVQWDERTAELWGRRDRRREIRFDEMLAAAHEKDRAAILARLQQPSGAGSGAFDSEMRVVGMDDGVLRWLQVQGQIQYEGGVPTRIVGRSLDVGERRAAEHANASLLAHERENTERLRALADASVKINEAARSGNVIVVVTEAARTLIPSHQALGASWMEGEPGLAASHRSLSAKYSGAGTDAPPPEPAGLWRVVREDQRVVRLGVAELDEKRQAGDWAGLERWQPALRGLLAAPLTARDGRTVGLILLSERESGEFAADDEAILVQLANVAAVALENSRFYAALREADQRKDEFLATLAHELRNPLAPIRSTLELLRIRRDEDALRTSLPLLDRQVSHLVRLVDDLFEVSRITRGAFELKRQRLELAGVLHTALETARPQLEAARHRVLVELPAQSLPMDADGLRLAQVFTNLLNNAAKYTPDGGEVRISARREGDEAIVVVADTGIGIAAETMPHIFDFFAQVDRKLRGSSDGLGIGLSIVKRLVEMHGGRVSAHSDGLGRGSQLEVLLPLSPHGAANQDAAEPSPALLPSPIMIVDDNRDAADSLAMLLGLLGSHASAYYSARSALAALPSLRPAVALLDIGMPDIDGFELARRIRANAETAGIRLIALSGWGQEADRQRSLSAGFDALLVKPVNLDALRAELLGGARPLRH